MDIEKLEKLNELKEKGIITEEEFIEQKMKVLSHDNIVQSAEKEQSVNSLSKIDSNYIWALVLAPIIGAFFKGFIAGLTSTYIDNWWFVTVIVNITFSYLDAKELKKCGYEEKFLDNAWFVPMYLYERSKLLKESQMYLIIWTVLLVLSCL